MVTFTLPTSRRITQEWGQDFNWLNGKHYPNGFYSTIGWLGHNGIDYGCPVGDNVEAVCDGVIEYVGPGNNHPLLTGGGNALLLRNDELGIRFEYLHLSQQNVYTGQKVKRGQVIAQSGDTGISSGPHLHLGAIPVRPNLNNGYRGRVDPTHWLYGPSNPDYAGLAAAGTTTPPAHEEIDMAAEENLLARLAQIVEWQAAQFREVRDNDERNRNILAGFVRDVVNAKETLTPEQLDEKLAGLTAAQEHSGVRLYKGDAADEVYVWDGAAGFRHIGQDEYLALITDGTQSPAILPQEIITNAAGGNK